MNNVACIGYADTIHTIHDDFKVYSYVLTQEEINTVYDAVQLKTFDILVDDQGEMLVDGNGEELGTYALPVRT